jgi:cysteine desulfurase
VSALGAAALVVSAAKIGAAAGVSALWHERGRALSPVLHGGQQERGFRPGTADVAALAGFGAAARAIEARLREMPRVAARRDRIERAACALGGVVNGEQGLRVASVSNVSFRGWRGDVLVAALDVEGLCVSAGAACSSGLGAPSPVLQAMYPGEPWRAESAVRFSLGPETTDEEVEGATEILTRVLRRSHA